MCKTLKYTSWFGEGKRKKIGFSIRYDTNLSAEQNGSFGNVTSSFILQPNVSLGEVRWMGAK